MARNLFVRVVATAVFFCALFLRGAPLRAEIISVRHVEGATHGFLVVHNTAGEAIAYGESIQDTKHGLVTSRLTFHFKDGSLYDDAVPR